MGAVEVELAKLAKVELAKSQRSPTVAYETEVALTEVIMRSSSKQIIEQSVQRQAETHGTRKPKSSCKQKRA